MVRAILRSAPVLVLAFVVSACGTRVNVHGDSMTPTIKDGEVVSYQDYGSASPQRGDVVVIKHAGVLRILRVIGLPGETVTLATGSVSIGGAPLVEPYLAAGTRTDATVAVWPVTNGSYFLLVDNRAVVSDSRDPTLGLVPRQEIVGKIAR